MNHSPLKACLALLCVSTVATVLNPIPAQSAPKHRPYSSTDRKPSRHSRYTYTDPIVDHDPLAIEFSNDENFLLRRRFRISLTDLRRNLTEPNTPVYVFVYTGSAATTTDSIYLELYEKFEHQSKKLKQLVNLPPPILFTLKPLDPDQDPQNRGASLIIGGRARFKLTFTDDAVATEPVRKVFLVAVKSSERANEKKKDCFQTITVVQPPPTLNGGYKTKGKSAGKRRGGRRTHG